MAILNIEVLPDCQIPDHVYDEAVELFQNHLKKYAEAQLLIDGSSLVLCDNLKKIYITDSRPIGPLGRSSIALYKNSRGVRNVILTPALQQKSIQRRNGLKKVNS